MTPSFPVFVGSTFRDLEPYREAACQALHRLETVVRGMEYFGSLPETPKEECLRIVRSCRAYVGIFAMRYGSVDAATGKSLTQLEYEEAQRVHLPSLVYLLDEERQPVLPRDIEFGEGAEKLRLFKATLRERHVISLFTTPEDLAVKITQDLSALANRSGVEVREGELSKIVAALPRIDWLSEERFAFLKREIGDLAASLPSDAILREVVEFILSGDRQAATFLVARATRLDFRASIDLLMAIDDKLKGVIERGLKNNERNGDIKRARALVPMALILKQVKQHAKEYVELEAKTKVLNVRFVKRYWLFGREDVVFRVRTTDKKDANWWVVGGLDANESLPRANVSRS